MAHARGRLVGVSVMVVSVLLFVTMNSLTKYCRLPPEQKVFVRMLVGVFIVAACVRAGFAKMEFNNIGLLALRGVFGAVSVMLYFYSIDHIPLGRAVFFQFTYPAWGALFSYAFLKENLGWQRAPALAATFAGAFLILVSGGASFGAISSGDVAGILCGLVSGAAVTTIRACHRYDSTHMIFLFFAAFGAMLGAAVTFAGGTYVAPTASGWALLAAIGVFGTAAQLFFTAGYRYLDVPSAGAIAMLQAPLSAVAGWLFFKEPMAGSAAVGAVLVLLGGAYLAMTSKGETLGAPQPPGNAATAQTSGPADGPKEKRK